MFLAAINGLFPRLVQVKLITPGIWPGPEPGTVIPAVLAGVRTGKAVR
jgi:hypothetical protein